jgi:hypothetical protein
MGHRRTDEHRQTHPSCPPDRKLFDNGWDIRKRPDGTTEWIPQPQLPLTGGGINTYHSKNLRVPRRSASLDRLQSIQDRPHQPIVGGTQLDRIEVHSLVQHHPLLLLLEAFEYVVDEVAEVLKRPVDEPCAVGDQLRVLLWDGMTSAVLGEFEEPLIVIAQAVRHPHDAFGVGCVLAGAPECPRESRRAQEDRHLRDDVVDGSHLSSDEFRDLRTGMQPARRLHGWAEHLIDLPLLEAGPALEHH